MPILKAKLKPLTEVPEDYKCCATAIAQLELCSSQVVEIDAQAYKQQIPNCFNCGKVYGERLVYRLIDGRGYFPVDCADIDEGTN